MSFGVSRGCSGAGRRDGGRVQRLGKRPLNLARYRGLMNCGTCKSCDCLPLVRSLMLCVFEAGERCCLLGVGRASPSSSSQRLQDQQQLKEQMLGVDHKPPLLPLLQKPATPWPRCSFQNVILLSPHFCICCLQASSHLFASRQTPSPRFQPSCYLLQEAFLTWLLRPCALSAQALPLCVTAGQSVNQTVFPSGLAPGALLWVSMSPGLHTNAWHEAAPQGTLST